MMSGVGRRGSLDIWCMPLSVRVGVMMSGVGRRGSLDIWCMPLSEGWCHDVWCW